MRETTKLPPTEAGFAKAERLLRKRLEAVEAGTLSPELRRTTWEQLATLIRDDYRAQGRRSAVRLGQSLAHLDRFFAGQRAAAITEASLARYTAHRLDEGAAAATVNRELAALHRAFRLALRARLVARVPVVDRLQEPPGRRGFFEREQLDAVLRRLPADVRPVALVAYVTGWRVHSEILTRQWQHVDLKAGWLRLEPGETKSGEGRQFPLTTELRRALKAQRARTTALERAEGRIIPWVFHRAGVPIRSFRRAWLSACRKAGLPGKIPHDFRRTAVRNLERAGVAQTAAMAMVGHRTASIYRRYAIVDETTLREAAKKLEAK